MRSYGNGCYSAVYEDFTTTEARNKNEEVKHRMGIECSIIDDVERKQIVWYKHVQRMDGKRLLK